MHYSKKICLIFASITLTTHAIQVHQVDENIEFVSFSGAKPIAKKPKTDLRVMLLTTQPFWGSVEHYHWLLHKALTKRGFDEIIVVDKGSPLQKQLIADKLDHFAISLHRQFPLIDKTTFESPMKKSLRKLAQLYDIDIIQLHNFQDKELAVKALRGLPIKIVNMLHQDFFPRPNRFDGLDGFLALNKDVLNHAKKINTEYKIGVRHFKHIYLLCDQSKFLRYRKPTLSRKQFFKKNYNIELTDAPVICMMSQFYGKESHIKTETQFRKNQSLLIQAAAKLVYERNKPIHVMFAGDGISRAWHEALAKELKLDQYVHFLGFCSAPQDIFHYSDFQVHTAIGEALGAVFIEAGYMKKPSIGASGTGAEYIIANGQTGLIFKNNDLEDLTNKIEFMIDHPDERKQMGKNVYDLVTGKKSFGKKNLTFLENIQVKSIRSFYKKIIKK